MNIKLGMKLQHIVTRNQGIVVRAPYTLGRNGGVYTQEYVDVSVDTDRGRFHRTWRTDSVKEVRQ
jgi:hypothetical protein